MSIQIKFGTVGNYNYDTLLDQFAKSVHSVKTSSIPMVQFWMKSAPERPLAKLEEALKFSLEDATLCFEYPTAPRQGIGSPSMTDLMILSDGNKVAIEAKYTEYSKTPEQTASEWLNMGKIPQNRETILEGWWKMIEPFRRNAQIFSNDIEYQFLHRTASACNEAKKAVVIYQLFYDATTRASLDLFERRIAQYVDIINPTSNLKFYIWEIEAKLIEKAADGYNPLERMKGESMYVFGKAKLKSVSKHSAGPAQISFEEKRMPSNIYSPSVAEDADTFSSMNPMIAPALNRPAPNSFPSLPYLKLLVVLLLLVVATLPFHYVIYGGMQMFPKASLTFSNTFITESDIERLISEYNKASALEQQQLRSDHLYKKLKERGVIVEKLHGGDLGEIKNSNI